MGPSGPPAGTSNVHVYALPFPSAPNAWDLSLYIINMTLQEPKGWLDLYESGDMDSRLVSRDVCARPHTLALAVAGGQRLLSADTREEAKRWCAGLNAALHWTRTWAC